MSFRRSIITILIFLSAIFRLSAQEKSSQVDSLVRLLSAQSMELIEKDGVDYRKVTGPAKFLHNDTYLICDTALWNMHNNEIYAISNVKILQEQTVLTGDRLTYYIDRDLAEFRGTLVQLEDKDHNVLRTEYLDYNTKDSVAVFFNGGAMKDKDGQIIESSTGTYDSKMKTFTFTDNVNMFTDSIFVKSSSIVYDSRTNVATFGYGTDAWREDNMLSSNAGWYDRSREIFLFRNKVHGMSDTQEGWADSLYYYRSSGDIELLGNAQVIDTTRDVSALAGRMYYTDSLSQITMYRKPAIIGVVGGDEKTAPDTVYFGADTLIARSMMKFQIPESELTNSKARLDNLAVDAVQKYRQKAAQEAADAAAKAAENDPNRPHPGKGNQPGGGNKDAVSENLDSGKHPEKKGASAAGEVASEKLNEKAAGDVAAKTAENDSKKSVEKAVEKPVEDSDDTMMSDSLGVNSADSLRVMSDSLSTVSDSLSVVTDSLSTVSDSLSVASDSLAVQLDSLSAPLDSTKFNFITGIRNAKMYRYDIQLACDSLAYSDLDSLVRMYKKPVVWNETNRQYAADSIYAVIKNRAMQKASLMSNAFIIVQEDSLCYDQIRATEMLAYFDTTGALRRFDALGEASAVFYLQEDSVYATVNKSEAKMLYAEFKDGDLDKVYYFESVKNDGYPVAQLRSDERVLKGFDWQPGRRPKGKGDITDIQLRASQRSSYSSRPKTSFEYTDRYYPGYMSGVYKQIEKGKVAKVEADARKRAAEHQSGMPLQDTTLTEVKTSLDSLASVSPSDSLSTSVDSLKTQSDSLKVESSESKVENAVASRSEKEIKKAQRDSLRAAKIAAREAKWARLDSLDAAKAQQKADKIAAKNRAKKLKQLNAMDEQIKKENARLEKYKAIYQKRKDRAEKRAALKAAKSNKNGSKSDKISSDTEATEEKKLDSSVKSDVVVIDDSSSPKTNVE